MPLLIEKSLSWMKNTSCLGKVGEQSENYLRSWKSRGTKWKKYLKVREKSGNWVENTSRRGAENWEEISQVREHISVQGWGSKSKDIQKPFCVCMCVLSFPFQIYFYYNLWWQMGRGSIENLRNGSRVQKVWEPLTYAIMHHVGSHAHCNHHANYISHA